MKAPIGKYTREILNDPGKAQELMHILLNFKLNKKGKDDVLVLSNGTHLKISKEVETIVTVDTYELSV